MYKDLKCFNNHNIYMNKYLLNVVYSCDVKAECSALLQSSVSHDPSEIILI